MCGIFGYIGNTNAAKMVATGLKRLEYRGYDSWGVAVLENSDIHVSKKVGAIGDYGQNLALPESFIGIGHTRWATHGSVKEINAHPHYSTDKSFTLAQNGILENYLDLKQNLSKKGYKFYSETDTEVIVRFVEETLKQTGDLVEAVRKAFQQMEGRNTIILLEKDGTIIACRNGSPLVVGRNEKKGEMFLSSDTLSFAPFVTDIIVLDNQQMVVMDEKNLELKEISSGKILKKNWEKLSFKTEVIDKGGFDHYMAKEINESPFVVEQLIDQEKIGYEKLADAIKQARKVYTIGSGTAGIAAAQIAFYLRIFGKIDALNLIGADANDYLDLFTKDDLIIAPSQSGETADVLEVLEKLKNKGVKIATFVNMPGSTMTRMADFPFMAQAGPEICVMSSKVFVSQIAWGYLLAKTVQGKREDGINQMQNLADQMENYLKDQINISAIEKLAKQLVSKKDIFLLGKFQNFQIIREGMVKLIEGTYKHAHAIPAGDLKHYAITLMEEGVPVIAVSSNDEMKDDIANAVNQIHARGATVIGVAPKKEDNFDHFLQVPDTKETSAIMNVIPLQLLAYYMAVKLGNNVDKPRNIAKSVTVK